MRKTHAETGCGNSALITNDFNFCQSIRVKLLLGDTSLPADSVDPGDVLVRGVVDSSRSMKFAWQQTCPLSIARKFRIPRQVKFNFSAEKFIYDIIYKLYYYYIILFIYDITT